MVKSFSLSERLEIEKRERSSRRVEFINWNNNTYIIEAKITEQWSGEASSETPTVKAMPEV